MDDLASSIVDRRFQEQKVSNFTDTENVLSISLSLSC